MMNTTSEITFKPVITGFHSDDDIIHQYTGRMPVARHLTNPLVYKI
jgi:hypothetical protein